jgi:hypothetical protein
MDFFFLVLFLSPPKPLHKRINLFTQQFGQEEYAYAVCGDSLYHSFQKDFLSHKREELILPIIDPFADSILNRSGLHAVIKITECIL